MKICIVNPGRCGSTLMLCYLHSKLPGYELKYEVITNNLPESENIIFKYQSNILLFFFFFFFWGFLLPPLPGTAMENW